MNQEQVTQTPSKTSGLAIAALVFCFVMAPVALVLGIVALNQIKNSKGQLTGNGMAIFSIVWGAVSFVFFFLGILAAVAIPAFINYMRRAKTTEATVNVERCYEGAVSYFEMQKSLPPNSDWTPQEIPSGDGAVPNQTLWQVSPWTELGFSMTTPHMYQYRFVNDGNTIACEARGDLDSDGKTSLFRMEGVIANDKVTRSGEIIKESPLE